MDRFLEMRVFATVVDAGSFVAAADTLELSKGAVSRHLKELETRLGVRLLHRTTRRLSLTPEGEIFHARCRELLRELEAAESEIVSHADQAIGLLRVSAPVTFGIRHLAPLWADFKRRHPRVELNITLEDRTVDLVDEGYDLAVRIGTLANSTLVSRRLASTRMVLCATPDYLARAGTPRHPSELRDHATLTYTYLATGDTWRFVGPDGEVSVEVKPCIRSNNGDTCLAGALQHHGLVLQPTFLVGPDLEAGRLVEVLPDYRAAEFGIYAVCPTRKHITPKVRALIDFLREYFRTSRWPA